MVPSLDSLGARVAARRSALGLTQRALADLCGCTEVTISSIERGVRPNVSGRTLEALSTHLGVTMDELVKGKASRSTRTR